MSPSQQLVMDAIRGAQRLVLTTHRGPDGDGIGAELGLARALVGIGKRVAIVNDDLVARRFRFLDPDGRVRTFRRPDANAVRGADLGLLLDASEVARGGRVAALRLKGGGPFLTVDHHVPTPDSLPGWIEPEAASTCELVYGLLRALGVPIDGHTAEALYAGIVYDTASFRYVRGRPDSFRIAAELVALGADADRVQTELFRHSREYLALLDRLLGEIRYPDDGRVAVLAVTRDHTTGLKLDADDTRDLVNVLNGTRGVLACGLLRQVGRRTWRVSLRSVQGIDIEPLARALGGGGHARAAGATVHEMDRDDLVALVEAGLSCVVADEEVPAVPDAAEAPNDAPEGPPDEE